GLQHGEQVRAPIRRAVEFYQGFFKQYLDLDGAEVRRRARRFLEPTARTSPQLLREFEGIAAGSSQALDDVLALSGRYEVIYETVKLGECSNVFVGPRRSAGG